MAKIFKYLIAIWTLFLSLVWIASCSEASKSIQGMTNAEQTGAGLGILFGAGFYFFLWMIVVIPCYIMFKVFNKNNATSPNNVIDPETKKATKGTKILFLVALAIFFIYFIGSQEQNKKTLNNQTSLNPSPSVDPSPITEVSCKQLSDTFSLNSTKTSIEKEKVESMIRDKYFKFPVIVVDVKSSGSSYTITWRCKGSNEYALDGSTETKNEKVKDLKKGQTWSPLQKFKNTMFGYVYFEERNP